MEGSNLGAYLCGDMDVIIFWGTRWMCVFGVYIVDTDSQYYEKRHPNFILYQNGK